MKTYCFKDGEIKKLSEASLALNDLGVLRGYAVFDFLRTYNGKPFHLKDHLARFKRATKHFRLNINLTEKEFEKIIKDLLKANNCQDGSIRLVATGGVSENGFDFLKPEFYILLEDLYFLPEKIFKHGGKIITHQFRRPFAEFKTAHYATSIYLQKKVKQAGAFELLYLDVDGTVREAATSNIFMFKKGVLYTTKDNILSGITRKTVIKLAKKKFKVVEKNFKLKELLSADEVFLTATNKQVAPVTKIDSQIIADGKVGEKTKILMADFKKYTDGY